MEQPEKPKVVTLDGAEADLDDFGMVVFQVRLGRQNRMPGFEDASICPWRSRKHSSSRP